MEKAGDSYWSLIQAYIPVLITSATALCVGYWHRKQARQIEAFRLNPEVGLLLSPSPVWRYIKENLLLLVAILNVYFLLDNVVSNEPVTRRTVLTICLNTLSIVIPVILHVAMAFYGKLSKIVKSLIEIDGLRIEQISQIAKHLGKTS